MPSMCKTKYALAVKKKKNALIFSNVNSMINFEFFCLANSGSYTLERYAYLLLIHARFSSNCSHYRSVGYLKSSFSFSQSIQSLHNCNNLLLVVHLKLRILEQYW